MYRPSPQFRRCANGSMPTSARWHALASVWWWTGRDIGTVVFPEADLKVFLTASPEARARRRLEQRGETVDAIELARETERLALRDRADASRSVAPLRRADEALEVDTTSLSFPEQVDRIVDAARRALAV